MQSNGSKNPTPRSGAYWGQLDPRSHAVQIYSNEATFLDSLEGFVGAGLRAGESVIVVATAVHLHELEMRLRGGWIDLDRARWEERYIAVLAQETLDRVMRDGVVNAPALLAAAAELIRRARGKANRPVRVCGEMVALLWAQGKTEEAMQLETLWTRLQIQENFPIFCAYPRSLFKNDAQLQITAVCGAHNRVVPGYIT